MQLWPIRVRWSNHRQWGWHGIECGAEDSPGRPGSGRYMPGLRGVFAEVLSIGRLRIVFGDTDSRHSDHIWRKEDGA